MVEHGYLSDEIYFLYYLSVTGSTLNWYLVFTTDL